MLIIDGYKLHSLDVWQGNTRWDANTNVSMNVFLVKEDKVRETHIEAKEDGLREEEEDEEPIE